MKAINLSFITFSFVSLVWLNHSASAQVFGIESAEPEGAQVIRVVGSDGKPVEKAAVMLLQPQEHLYFQGTLAACGEPLGTELAYTDEHGEAPYPRSAQQTASRTGGLLVVAGPRQGVAYRALPSDVEYPITLNDGTPIQVSIRQPDQPSEIEYSVLAWWVPGYGVPITLEAFGFPSTAVRTYLGVPPMNQSLHWFMTKPLRLSKSKDSGSENTGQVTWLQSELSVPRGEVRLTVVPSEWLNNINVMEQSQDRLDQLKDLSLRGGPSQLITANGSKAIEVRFEDARYSLLIRKPEIADASPFDDLHTQQSERSFYLQTDLKGLGGNLRRRAKDKTIEFGSLTHRTLLNRYRKLRSDYPGQQYGVAIDETWIRFDFLTEGRFELFRLDNNDDGRHAHERLQGPLFKIADVTPKPGALWQLQAQFDPFDLEDESKGKQWYSELWIRGQPTESESNEMAMMSGMGPMDYGMGGEMDMMGMDMEMEMGGGMDMGMGMGMGMEESPMNTLQLFAQSDSSPTDDSMTDGKTQRQQRIDALRQRLQTLRDQLAEATRLFEELESSEDEN